MYKCIHKCTRKNTHCSLTIHEMICNKQRGLYVGGGIESYEWLELENSTHDIDMHVHIICIDMDVTYTSIFR